MFENIMKFFRKLVKNEEKEESSKDTAKERLHLVLMQDRANVSADFLEMMKQEILDVIKKYIEIDEKEIDVDLTNKVKEDGTNGAPFLYANIPILNIKNEMKKEETDINEDVSKNANNKNKEEVLEEKSEQETDKEKVKKEEVKTEEIKENEKEEVAESKKDTEKKEKAQPEKKVAKQQRQPKKENKIKTEKGV